MCARPFAIRRTSLVEVIAESSPPSRTTLLPTLAAAPSWTAEGSDPAGRAIRCVARVAAGAVVVARGAADDAEGSIREISRSLRSAAQTAAAVAPAMITRAANATRRPAVLRRFVLARRSARLKGWSATHAKDA